MGKGQIIAGGLVVAVGAGMFLRMTGHGPVWLQKSLTQTSAIPLTDRLGLSHAGPDRGSALPTTAKALAAMSPGDKEALLKSLGVEELNEVQLALLLAKTPTQRVLEYGRERRRKDEQARDGNYFESHPGFDTPAYETFKKEIAKQVEQLLEGVTEWPRDEEGVYEEICFKGDIEIDLDHTPQRWTALVVVDNPSRGRNPVEVMRRTPETTYFGGQLFAANAQMPTRQHMHVGGQLMFSQRRESLFWVSGDSWLEAPLGIDFDAFAFSVPWSSDQKAAVHSISKRQWIPASISWTRMSSAAYSEIRKASVTWDRLPN